MITIPYIGFIKSNFTEATDPDLMREEESELVIDEKFSEGLFTIELNDYIEVYFHFHKSEPFNPDNSSEFQERLKTHTRTGNYRGVFATRAPNRPSQIGSTMVKLIERNHNVLRVAGLDAIDGTPIIDIKPLHITLTSVELKMQELKREKFTKQ